MLLFVGLQGSTKYWYFDAALCLSRRRRTYIRVPKTDYEYLEREWQFNAGSDLVADIALCYEDETEKFPVYSFVLNRTIWMISGSREQAFYEHLKLFKTFG